MQQVFLHGLGQTPECWAETIVQLESAEHSVCPNLSEILRGKDASYQNLYEAVSEICNQSRDELDLFGLSLGGVLALNYAIEHPQKVHSMVLIAPQYKMPKNLLRIQNLLFQFMPKSAFQATGFDKRAFIRLCETMMDIDFSNSLSKISCPTLILYGERDSANKKSAVALAGLLQNAEVREIIGAGHEVNKDAPEKMCQAVSDFCRHMK